MVWTGIRNFIQCLENIIVLRMTQKIDKEEIIPGFPLIRPEPDLPKLNPREGKGMREGRHGPT